MFLFISLSAKAQTYVVNWWAISGGGGTSTSSIYQVRGTIGQSDVGLMTNRIYALRGGFWGGAVAVQTPDAPYLSITNSNANVVVAWPKGDSDWRLECTFQLETADTSIWTLIPPPYSTNATECVVTELAPMSIKFYRLRKP